MHVQGYAMLRGVKIRGVLCAGKHGGSVGGEQKMHVGAKGRENRAHTFCK